MGGVEKPMLELAGRRFVERVVSALRDSKKFERIVAVVSPNTPATKKFLASAGIEIMETPGKGYPHDLAIALERLSPDKVLVVPADVPLLTAQTVGEIADALTKINAPAASIAVDKSFVEDLNITPSVVSGGMCHSGITLFDSSKKGEVEERYVTMNKIEIAMNVNTKKEKELAESLVKRANDLAGYPGL
jgi:adenosylcobinamide-phosphate guanylyltransferase